MFVVHIVVPLLLVSVLLYIFVCWRPSTVDRDMFPKEKQNKQQKHVLFVTAHPDDECMFFAPTLASLSRRRDVTVSLLCLSKGDFDGHGDVRKKELIKAGVRFGLTPDSVIIVDDPHLPDDPKQSWNVALVAKTVEAVAATGDVDAIFTFDYRGISGHQNHIAAYMGVKHMALTSQKFKFRPLNVYALESVGFVRKDSQLFVADLQAYSMGVQAMIMHESQLVWFRKLYLAFSRYMFINTYSKIN
ncbi:putative deacetylase LmbE-like domain-containing protein [Kickxella alabastrina]|uniref:putative deacetylase LmbE-like domain-containing protein n=1 Tax=Kickxella alabastrina TaxID=61397 RepID=UPI00222081AC|nr:putative deacetylase LmbE-like domain-containing protein [Kickxella alabastrina]KAI7824008.1 putative deacetylase LmbE-like domain-containing protein [Kickxella alabastrina]